jgi:hypothetical protein
MEDSSSVVIEEFRGRWRTGSGLTVR